MLNILKKFFSSTKNLNNINHRFIKLRKERNVEKIFDAIESYSNKAEIRYVGGCVRKIINNEKVDDIDLATNIDPTKVKEALKKKNINYFETGIEHGTITALIENDKFEITSLRSDIKTDGRHAEIEFTTDWIKDAERRDFTINSIYADINGNLFDPFDGKKDLENGLIKFVGEPERRIEEDYLRILRYFRFFALYSKNKHLTEIKKAIKKNIVGIKKLSSERLLDELKKIYKSNCFIKLCEVKFSYEIICAVFPEFKQIEFFKKLNDYTKNNLHNLDFTFFLSLLVLDNTDNSDYFFYKFNISKKDQKRLENINNFYREKITIRSFSENNLNKLFYFYGKQTVIDILSYKLFISKRIDQNLINLLETYQSKVMPPMPIRAKDLISKYKIPEGKTLGVKLKMIEKEWVKNNFYISEKEIEKIVNS